MFTVHFALLAHRFSTTVSCFALLAYSFSYNAICCSLYRNSSILLVTPKLEVHGSTFGVPISSHPDSWSLVHRLLFAPCRLLLLYSDSLILPWLLHTDCLCSTVLAYLLLKVLDSLPTPGSLLLTLPSKMSVHRWVYSLAANNRRSLLTALNSHFTVLCWLLTAGFPPHVTYGSSLLLVDRW